MFEKPLQKFFFDAMRAGWAGEGKWEVVPNMPGYKMFRHEDGDLLLTDICCTNRFGSFSSGTTTIYLNGQPIWWMCYFGSYHKEAIPCLRTALLEAYEKLEFNGGRGQVGTSTQHGFTYKNELSRKAFTDFAGRESIHDSNGRELGWHDYYGLSLVE